MEIIQELEKSIINETDYQIQVDQVLTKIDNRIAVNQHEINLFQQQQLDQDQILQHYCQHQLKSTIKHINGYDYSQSFIRNVLSLEDSVLQQKLLDIEQNEQKLDMLQSIVDCFSAIESIEDGDVEGLKRKQDLIRQLGQYDFSKDSKFNESVKKYISQNEVNIQQRLLQLYDQYVKYGEQEVIVYKVQKISQFQQQLDDLFEFVDSKLRLDQNEVSYDQNINVRQIEYVRQLEQVRIYFKNQEIKNGLFEEILEQLFENYQYNREQVDQIKKLLKSGLDRDLDQVLVDNIVTVYMKLNQKDVQLVESCRNIGGQKNMDIDRFVGKLERKIGQEIVVQLKQELMNSRNIFYQNLVAVIKNSGKKQDNREQFNVLNSVVEKTNSNMNRYISYMQNQLGDIHKIVHQIVLIYKIQLKLILDLDNDYENKDLQYFNYLQLYLNQNIEQMVKINDSYFNLLQKDEVLRQTEEQNQLQKLMLQYIKVQNYSHLEQLRMADNI